MFNVGGGELLVILLLGLLILGPERLPKAMGEIGKYVAQLRRMSSGFQDEIRRAMDPDDVPFRPGEERLSPGNVDDEVRVVGADPPDGAEDGIIDTTAVEDDPSHAPLDDEGHGPFRPAVADGPAAGAADDADAPAPEAARPPGADEDPADQGTDADRGDPGNVTPLRGRDDGGTRAAG